NIHKGIGGVDRRYRIDRVVAVLAELAPDVALLQEVTDGLPRASFHDQAELLGEALGMEHVAFCPQHRFSIGGYGNAILSRFPITSVEEIDLTVGWRKRRGALGAHLRVRIDGHSRTVVLWNLHLGLAGSERGLQLERFLASPALGRIHQPTPVVVAGDLNDLWGSLGPRFLGPAGFVRAGRVENTFPAAMPLRPLDGIFVRGGVRAHHCGPHRNALTRQASDHLPLCARLELATDLDAPAERGRKSAPPERS
ncbi:MAG TPA: endonuclease/exonuclease/phosphatase family protein, partial [Polyangiaceae bacterium]|nr:endonuclease/exonuclease/phosphatase family protein [Polyangiaceae bacterium]